MEKEKNSMITLSKGSSVLNSGLKFGGEGTNETRLDEVRKLGCELRCGQMKLLDFACEEYEGMLTKLIKENEDLKSRLSQLEGSSKGKGKEVVPGKAKAPDSLPTLLKTERCIDWKNKRVCNFGIHCKYYHAIEEKDTPVVPKPPQKTRSCPLFARDGFCKFGESCMFIHD